MTNQLFFTFTVYSTDKLEHFSWEEPVHISFFSIFVRMRGIQSAISGSSVKCFTTMPNQLARKV